MTERQTDRCPCYRIIRRSSPHFLHLIRSKTPSKINIIRTQKVWNVWRTRHNSSEIPNSQNEIIITIGAGRILKVEGHSDGSNYFSALRRKKNFGDPPPLFSCAHTVFDGIRGSAGLMPTEARGNCNRACSAWVHRTCLITIYQYDYHIIQW